MLRNHITKRHRLNLSVNDEGMDMEKNRKERDSEDISIVA